MQYGYSYCVVKAEYRSNQIFPDEKNLKTLGGGDTVMASYTWSDDSMKEYCALCHWKDDDANLCHAVEPPRKKELPLDGGSVGLFEKAIGSEFLKNTKNDFLKSKNNEAKTSTTAFLLTRKIEIYNS